MTIKAFTMLERALREDSNGVVSHVLRVCLAFILFLFVCFFAVGSSFMTAPGRELFLMVVWVDYIVLTIVGISLFSSVITEEKEAQTIGLLRMAGITPLQLIIGKVAGKLWIGGMLLLVQVPFVVLSVTLGGVSMHQVFAAFVALAVHLLCLANVALFASMMARNRRTAAGLTCFLMGVIMLGFLLAILIGEMMPGRGFGPETISQFAFTSIAFFLAELSELNYEKPIFLNAFVISNVVIAFVAFVLSMLLFPAKVVDDEPDDSMRGDGVLQLFTFGMFSPGRVKIAPVAWKDFYFHLGGWNAMLFRLICTIALGIAAVFVINGGNARFRADDTAMGLTVFGFFWLVLQAGWHLSRTFAAEERSNSWPSLVTLPMTTYAVLWQKIVAVLIHLIPPLLLMLVGIAIHPAEVIDELGTAWLIIPLAWSITFVHLCMWYAVMLKWGGFALAIVTTWIGLPMLTGFVGGMFAGLIGAMLGSEAGVAASLAIPALGFTAFLNWHITYLMKWRASIST